MPIVGMERAQIAAVDDPEERGRCRVRVFKIHDDSIPDVNLPWAELAVYAGSGWGDVAHYQVGDLVWCMFEGGDPEYPVVMAGWITAPKGVSGLPSEQTSDYPNDRERWVHKDRKGNLIEMSEKDGELHVRLKSGGAELKVTQKDNSFAVTASGPASITVGGAATIQADGDAVVKSTGGKVTIEGSSEVAIAPKCVVDGGGSKVLTDTIIPACIFAGVTFTGNAKLEVKP